MSQQRVRAVIYVRYTRSNFKALYGRLANSSYTKDFLQIPPSASQKIVEALGGSSDRTDVTYVWPGGEQPNGYLLHSSDRYHLGWGTNEPPLPWRVGDVTAQYQVSIEGTYGLQDQAGADANFEATVASATNPWLIAVKLAGEGSRLHIRVYFENPPASRPDRGLGQLPTKLQAAIRTHPTTSALGVMLWADRQQPVPRAEKVVKQVLEALRREPNVLLVGPPGTGKSVALEDLREFYTSSLDPETPVFDPEEWDGDWGVINVTSKDEESEDSRNEALVFHPSYSYENFVAGLFPVSVPNSGIRLEAKAGPLLSLSHWASGGTNRKALLILDEFNRGAAAAIFGDTLGLLDGDKRSGPNRMGANISRPYPSQDMPVSQSYRRDPNTAEQIDAEVSLAEGLHIVAAMNSTDRSVAPLDVAMRRRFTIIRVGPDYDALEQNLLDDVSRTGSAPPTDDNIAAWSLDDVALLATRLLRSVNDRIEYCLGDDFLLGHALFWQRDGTTVEERVQWLSLVMDTKVVPTLRTTFIDQDEVLAAVLGIADVAQVGAGQPPPAGVVGYWRMAPTALASIAPKRLRIQPLHAMDATQQLRALLSIANP